MGEAKQRNEPPQDPEGDSLGQLIDGLCDQFEARWKSGERPRIEDFLGHVPEPDRCILLAQILGIELHWRRQNSETPTPQEYTERFPAYRETIQDQFLADRQRPSVANAEAETLLLQPDPQSTTHKEAGRQLGHYQLLEELGRGGMGVVYRAWQPNANRYVALKLIRRDRLESLPHEDQRRVIHRFEHEAQAAGRIEHDHIVTVYEVGEVGGEHFFSMRYVEGLSLNDLLKEGPLSGRDAARYLESVARAVHEAHLHGILHRDIKPQNILIDAKTDRAMVVDFGLAKLAEGAEAVTEAGDVMGTPSYMPPEQAKDSSCVTAKSDVYSLGATLYHAITGQAPFRSNSVLETIRLVVDQPVIPPRQIDAQIDRDLETICLKCLEKEPARRYASAEALADELRRYLNHEPIEARPLGPVGRTLRWCRRYPVVALLLGCTGLFFLAALTTSIVGYVETSRALQISENNYQRARQTVDWFFTRVSEESLLNQPGLQPLRQDLLEQALRYYEEFVEERGDDPTVRDELAASAYRLGRITEQLGSVDEAERWYRRALDIQEELAKERPKDESLREELGDTVNAMGGILLAQHDLDKAQASYRRAAKEREELARTDPENAERQRKLANSFMNLGVVARESGNTAEAEKCFVRAQTLRYEILEREHENTKTRRDLAKGCYNLANLYTSIEPLDADRASANLVEALGLFEELLDEQPNDLANQYRTAVTARLYADLLCHMRRTHEARQHYQHALDLMRHLAYLNPDVPGYRFEQAGILMNLGLILDEHSKTADSFAEAGWILKDLSETYPEEPKYERDLAAVLCATGNLSADTGDLDSALQLMRQAREHFEQLCTQYPEHEEYSQLLEDVVEREKVISTLVNKAASQESSDRSDDKIE